MITLRTTVIFCMLCLIAAILVNLTGVTWNEFWLVGLVFFALVISEFVLQVLYEVTFEDVDKDRSNNDGHIR